MSTGRPGPFAPLSGVAVLDLLAKGLLVSFLVLVVIDPAWGNLEGKAPLVRAVTYPVIAFAVPLWWGLRRPDAPYPWLADLLLTLVGFSDILGNRLDLFDSVVWFDDWMHFANSACLTAGLVMLTLHRTASRGAVLERALALGLTSHLVWEVYEYFAFVTRSPELPTAYADTIGDMVLGFLGILAAAWVVHAAWRHHLPEVEPTAAGPERGVTGSAAPRSPR